MQLTLIPDDPDAETIEIDAYSFDQEPSIGSRPVWSADVSRYTGNGSKLRNETETVTDIAGWLIVVTDDDSDTVRAAGVIDDIQEQSQKYRLTIVGTDSPTPDFINSDPPTGSFTILQ